MVLQTMQIHKPLMQHMGSLERMLVLYAEAVHNLTAGK